MASENPTNPDEPRLLTRKQVPEHDPAVLAERFPAVPKAKRRDWRLGLIAPIAVLVIAIAGLSIHLYLVHMTQANLPQLDGTAIVPGLAARVTIERDRQGVPHIRAQSLDDLVMAQAWVTAHDRLWQMDILRRHAAGELAAILGPTLLPHDRLQRTLQIRAAADRAVANLPPDQLHLLTVYAQGVNAAIADQRDRLPIEFRVLGYKPAPWTPRDSILVSLAMFQDLTDAYQQKLDREALTARLAPDLVADLYPVGSWRDHPPTQPPIDLTIEGPAIEDVPLDESQSKLSLPEMKPDILAEVQSIIRPDCPECIPGSNNWVVAGSRTASGKPLLSNDMHLSHSIPGIWYEASLEAPMPNAEPLSVAGVTLPGLPLVVVGHNQHIAWGFTNLGADVQDLYIENTRNNNAEFQAPDGSWQPVVHLAEEIAVHNGATERLDVLATRHGDAVTPILTKVLPPLFGHAETRAIALRWTIYDPNVLRLPVLYLDCAHDWTSFTGAIAQFGGPAQNMVYADDQGHIGYHATGFIPMRGATPATGQAAGQAAGPSAMAIPNDLRAPHVDPLTAFDSPFGSMPTPLTEPATQGPQATPMRSGPISPVPAPTDKSREWIGYIPFDQLPQAFDPPGGILATANGRITPDGYPYPIALNWGAPYRTERIWRLLESRYNLTPADMLAIQNDLYSDFDHVLAQRIAYAVDHSHAVQITPKQEQAALRQAADILRVWNGNVETSSVAANIVAAAKTALWPLLLDSKVRVQQQPKAKTSLLDVMSLWGSKPAAAPTLDPSEFYTWHERDYALEQLLMHTPQRWLPPHIADWDDLLATALDKGLADAQAPMNSASLAKWSYGRTHVVDIESALFGSSKLLSRLLRMHTGTGPHPQAGDGTTVKQVGRVFGPSERLTADLGDPDRTTLNIVTGESGNPASPYYLDQFQAWYRGTTYPFPLSDGAVHGEAVHTLVLKSR